MSYKVMRMQMCGPLDNAKPKAENVRGLNIIKVLMLTGDTELHKNMGSNFRDIKILMEISPFYVFALSSSK